MKFAGINKYPQPCHWCGCTVKAKSGKLFRQESGCYIVVHHRQSDDCYNHWRQARRLANSGGEQLSLPFGEEK